jgi:hypothetical protein
MAQQQPTTAVQSKRVETRHASYKARASQWRRCRDCYEGTDAVKAEEICRTYLPLLDTMRQVDNDGRYQAYKTRALFFNAMSRTVDGLAGAVFQKDPKTDVPKSFKPVLDDATLRGEPANLVALLATREVMITGRYGVLNWRETVIDGNATLTMVVLREDELVPKNGDEFDLERRDVYRVLRLTGGEYSIETWKARETQGASVTLYEPSGTVTPTRRGQPLDFIPFTFFGPTSTAVDVQKPPMVDLADVNLSHYRTSADLEHGRHYVALPTPWMAGASADQTGELILGPSGMLLLDKGGVAGMLEFSGSGLGSLEKADDTKRQMMATLGARLLEDQGGPAETATAVGMRHAGEHATLRTIAGSIEEGFEEVLRTSVWWTTPSAGKWEDVEVEFELNKDYLNVKMSSEEAKTLVLMLQAESISHETFWTALTTGNFVNSPNTSAEEKKQIEREKPPEPPPGAPGAPVTGLPGGMPGVNPRPVAKDVPVVAPPGMTKDQARAEGAPPGGGTLAVKGGPYNVVDRRKAGESGHRWCVVKQETGAIVSGGDHGNDRGRAVAHLRALEAAMSGERKK